MNATSTTTARSHLVKIKRALDKIFSNSKGIIAVISLAIFSILFSLILWVTEPEYRLLYSHISDKDAGAIVAQLTQQQIPYRFNQQDGAIMVPEEWIYETRLRLAQQGLPKGSATGFELMDKEKFGLSQFSEQVNYQRALEGELVRTIEILEPVSSARVHLALPKPSLFVREQKPASASVTLTLTPGMQLDAGQVAAIAHMVASAIPGMRPEQVTLVDQHGALLKPHNGMTPQSEHLKFVHEVEADYLRRILSILAPVVGADNVQAQVTAQFDFTEREQTDERYQPNYDGAHKTIRSNQSLFSEQRSSQRAGGVPGALTNQPPVPSVALIDSAAITSSGKSDGVSGEISEQTMADIGPPFQYRNDQTTNYEVDKTLIHTRYQKGALQRLSAAVVINYVLDNKGEMQRLSEQRLVEMTALVKEAIGYSSARGDSLNIVNMPFSIEDDSAVSSHWSSPEMIGLISQGLRYLMVFLVVWVMWWKGIKPFWIRQQELSAQRIATEEKIREQERQNVEQQQVQDQHDSQFEHYLNVLKQFAERDPHLVALILQQWIKKEQDAS